MDANLLYIVFHGINKAGGGIGKKISSQVKAFQDIGVKTSLSVLEINSEGKYVGRSVDGKFIEKFKPFFGRYIQWKWRYKYKKLLEYITDKNINVVYIRYSHFANPFFIRFLKKIKKNNVHILMEIPSFPYDNEYKNVGLSSKIIKRTEEIYRLRLKGVVDKMVTYASVSDIFGVETIKINNGIDIGSIPLKKKRKADKDIHLIAVAVINIWHGYDRLIEGLKDYYNKDPQKKIYLHIVGDGNDPESKKYREMVNKYNLNDFILFYGFKKGDELNELFDRADFAVGSIGVHRIGLTHTNPIKFGEYSARGIPFLYSGIYDLFENQSFIYKVPNDETPIDVKQLLEFISNYKVDSSELRKFAEENLSWEIQMKKILDELGDIA